MTFTLRHPEQPHVVATYGFDPQRGVWALVRREAHVTRDFAPILGDFVEFRFRPRVLGTYDATQDGYDSVEPVRGLLQFLAGAGFFDAPDVEEAVDIVGAGGVVGVPRRLRRIVDVLKDLDDALA